MVFPVFSYVEQPEGMSMTLEEQKEIAEEWVKYQENDFKVIVHVGTTSFKQSQELARHAQVELMEPA